MQRILFVIVVILLSAFLLGCSSPANTAPTIQPTSAVSASSSSQSTLASAPAQPTSPPIATRNATPFQTAAPAQILSVPMTPTPASAAATRTSSSAASSSAASTASSSSSAASSAAASSSASSASSAASSAGPVPTAAGVATGKRSEVKLAFLTPLKAREEAEPAEMEPMRVELKKLSGFMDMSGDEDVVTVGYDAGLVTVEQLIQRFAQLGHPVKKQ